MHVYTAAAAGNGLVQIIIIIIINAGSKYCHNYHDGIALPFFCTELSLQGAMFSVLPRSCYGNGSLRSIQMVLQLVGI
jgi:hypothetical protein